MGKVIALVPLRGGSKSIPDKNIRPIAKKPLCAWAIEAACQSGVFDEVVVSTDSKKIAGVVKSLGLPVSILDRPFELATDIASTESVMLHAGEHYDFDLMCLVQATNPFVTSENIKAAYHYFLQGGFDSLLSGARQKHFYWSVDGTPLNYDPLNRPRRQDFSGVFMENGAFYFTKKEVLEKHRCRLGGKIGVFEMPEFTALDIDEEEDWPLADRLLARHVLHSKKEGNEIKLFVTDVDGVLTDAGMYYSEAGDELKKFNTRDGKGLELLRNAGIKTAFITSEETRLVKRRAEKLKVDYLYQGETDGGKLSVIHEICRKEGITLEEVSYIGDDINCYEALLAVALAACPADAAGKIKSVPGILQLQNKGGQGVVREFAELILENLHKTNEQKND